MNEQYPQPQTSIPELLESLNGPQPTVVAFEGGPCGGKTTIVNQLAEAAIIDRPVVVLPEAATQHIEKLMEAGLNIPDLAMHDRPGFLAFEADVLGTIVQNIQQAKAEWAGTNALIVADRSDIGAYVSAEEYQIILGAIDRSQPPHMDLVDKMVYLPSVARESVIRYREVMQGNTARYEDAEDAIRTCRRNLAAVAMHPELSVRWGGTFEDKVVRVTDEVLHPEREVEAKFTLDDTRLSYNLAPALLRGATTAKLGEMAITQSYHEWEGEEFRLRRTQTDTGHPVHHYTVKSGEGSVRHEVQRTITDEQYSLLKQTPEFGELHKTRQRYLLGLPHDRDGRQTVLSADFYDDRQLCVLEVEGVSDAEAAGFDIPGFIQGGVPARQLVQ